jgi:hypothetical protein
VLTLIHPGSDLHRLGGHFSYYRPALYFEIIIVFLVVLAALDTTTHLIWCFVIGVAFIVGPGLFASFHQLELGQLVGAGMVVVLLLGLRLYKEPHPKQATGNSGP